MNNTNLSANQMTLRFGVFFRGELVATCKTLQAARNKRDRLDDAYGASVHVAKQIN